jgi:hypothetical protein
VTAAELASSQHLRKLHAAFVLPATINRKKQSPTGDPAKQRAFELLIRKRTADELKEPPVGASAMTEGDSEIKIVGCTSVHKPTAGCHNTAATTSEQLGGQNNPQAGTHSPENKDPRKTIMSTLVALLHSKTHFKFLDSFGAVSNTFKPQRQILGHLKKPLRVYSLSVEATFQAVLAHVSGPHAYGDGCDTKHYCM